MDERDVIIAEQAKLIAEQAAIISAQSKLIAEQAAIIESLRAEVAMLRAKVEELTRKLDQNSSNSSLPPSTDRGKNEQRNTKKGVKHGKPGPPKGHKGQARIPVSAEQVDEVVEHREPTCGMCGRDLSMATTKSVERFQVAELAPQVATTTEHLFPRLICACGHVQKSSSQAIRKRCVGPRLASFIALASGGYRLSKLQTQRLLRDLGVTISTGSITNIEREVSNALATVDAELMKKIRSSDAGYADETSWFEKHRTHWLWVLVTKSGSLFRILKGRSAECATLLLGDFSGVLQSDRLKSYGKYSGERQTCWAHILRKFQEWSEAEVGTQQQRLGALLHAETTSLLKAHALHRARSPTDEAGETLAVCRAHAETVFALLEQGMKVHGELKLMRQCKPLVLMKSELFRFLDDDLIEPTNNVAERALRGPVIHRKTSFGTQSNAGSRFLERMWTVLSTLKVHSIDALDFVARAVTAFRSGLAAPQL